MPLTATEKAYLAGIMDGEGSITFVKHHRNRSRGRYIYPLTRIANTSEALIAWIKDRVPYGATHTVNRPDRRSKLVHHIAWAGKDAVAILSDLLPYLVIKRDQAELVLRTNQLNTGAAEAAGGKFGHGRELPEWLLVERLSAFEEIQRLNRKGWSHAS